MKLSRTGQGQGTSGLTTDQIAAFVAGTADPATARRVAAAAVADKTVRERIERLRAVEALPDDPAAAVSEEQLSRLRTRLLRVARAVTDEAEAARRLAVMTRGGGLWCLPAPVWETVTDAVADAARALTTGRHPICLPCLAPASAAPAASLVMHRESVITADGVRIEFQQLPGETARLRLIVDASDLSGDVPVSSFNTAFVRLNEEDPESPSRHILVVALNREGRGFTDFSLGYGNGSDAQDPRVLPVPRAVCNLTGASLVHLPGPDSSAPSAPG